MDLDTNLSTSKETSKMKHPSKDLIIHSNIIIMAPPLKIYDFWRDLSNLPRFSEQLESVEQLSKDLSRWTWKTLKGQKKVEWNSEIIEDQPGQLISWRTLSANELKHIGTISFKELPQNRGTFVDVKIIYDPPGGKITELLEKVIGDNPQENLRFELFKLRELLEVGEIPIIDGQPRGGLH